VEPGWSWGPLTRALRVVAPSFTRLTTRPLLQGTEGCNRLLFAPADNLSRAELYYISLQLAVVFDDAVVEDVRAGAPSH